MVQMLGIVLLTIFSVGSVKFMGYPHAMVLDTIKDGKFIFKNTQSENKKFEIEVLYDDAPEEFYFVHLKLDLSRLDQIRQTLVKKSLKKLNIQKPNTYVQQVV